MELLLFTFHFASNLINRSERLDLLWWLLKHIMLYECQLCGNTPLPSIFHRNTLYIYEFKPRFQLPHLVCDLFLHLQFVVMEKTTHIFSSSRHLHYVLPECAVKCLLDIEVFIGMRGLATPKDEGLGLRAPLISEPQCIAAETSAQKYFGTIMI